MLFCGVVQLLRGNSATSQISNNTVREPHDLLAFLVRDQGAESHPRVWGEGTACALEIELGEQRLVFDYLGLS